ncbi:hydrolase [Verrucomicrobiaceae bacterium SCGC AG-212-N21]|nr:hydrolase [Verrucomicrobiaceae bacterium SCGC AG-212-N21]
MTLPPPAPQHSSETKSDSLRERLQCIRHVALDMDGTIYHGDSLFPCTNPFLATLTQLGIGYSFLTNNSSRSADDYVMHLRKLGIPAQREQIYTSAQATIEYLREEMPEVKRLFLLGTESLQREIASAGFTLTADSASDAPDAVLAGFDMDLTYARLCRAAWWIKQGKPFLASHPDRICPSNEPTVLVDCGAICALLESATGRAPDAILGKPDPRMLFGLAHRHDLQPEELAMVGDRLYTDIEMARRSGALGVLVLSGEATAEDAAACAFPPDLVLADLSVLGQKLQQAHG